jgi:hypothetical protein
VYVWPALTVRSSKASFVEANVALYGAPLRLTTYVAAFEEAVQVTWTAGEGAAPPVQNALADAAKPPGGEVQVAAVIDAVFDSVDPEPFRAEIV